MKNLKLCPFCGGEPELKTGKNGKLRWIVCGDECGKSGLVMAIKAEDENKAIDRWNTRPLEDQTL